jgi:hypothetical protein
VSNARDLWIGFAAVARTLGPLVLTTLLLGWGPPGRLLMGALMPLAAHAMGPAARRGDQRRRAEGDDVQDSGMPELVA